jgi:hypothetical protein
MHGYARMVGLHPTTFTHPNSHTLFRDCVCAIRARTEFRVRAQHLRRDGSVFDAGASSPTSRWTPDDPGRRSPHVNRNQGPPVTGADWQAKNNHNCLDCLRSVCGVVTSPSLRCYVAKQYINLSGR